MGREVTGDCSQRHSAVPACAHSSGIPSSSFPALSHILQSPALLSSAAVAATIASAGSGHWGVTRGTPAVSLTGCDTVPSTINEYKRNWADSTWQLSVAFQALMARWVASSHPTQTLWNKNGQWWKHGEDVLKCFIQLEAADLKKCHSDRMRKWWKKKTVEETEKEPNSYCITVVLCIYEEICLDDKLKQLASSYKCYLFQAIPGAQC